LTPALAALAAAGFDEPNVCRLFEVPVVSDVRHVALPPPDRRPRRGLGALIALFVAGEEQNASQLDAAALAAFAAADLIEQDGDRVAPRLRLLPVRGIYSAGDPIDLSAVNCAHCLPTRLDGKRVFDVGCGAGLLALLCARAGAEVTGGDVYEAALDFARRGAALHELEARFVESDLFSAAEGQYDLVLFNAPLLRAPLAAATGDDVRYTHSPEGETLALRFLEELPTRLREGGEALLHAQLTPAVDGALLALAARAHVLSLVFARAPDGTPHALTQVRTDRAPAHRRVELPLGPYAPHLAREMLDALVLPIMLAPDATPVPAPWLELRESRRLSPAAPDLRLRFGVHTIDTMERDLLLRLDGRDVAALGLDENDRQRLARLAEIGLVLVR
jgi:SAM-dependent methyltransferase